MVRMKYSYCFLILYYTVDKESKTEENINQEISEIMQLESIPIVESEVYFFQISLLNL